MSDVALPDLNEAGDLPLGVHRATLDEIVLRFGISSAQRQRVASRLERICQIGWSTGLVARLIVFGSFITSKATPNDVDVFLLMEDSFDSSATSGEMSLLFDHAAAQSHFGASVFWLRRAAALGGEQATVEYWQAKRDGGLRGVVEIVREQP